MLQVKGMLLQRFEGTRDIIVLDVPLKVYEEDVLPRLSDAWTGLDFLQVDAPLAELSEGSYQCAWSVLHYECECSFVFSRWLGGIIPDL